MRLNEICQLDVTDVRTADGVACFFVTEDSLSGSGDKSLKIASSRRVVQVHPVLIKLGSLYSWRASDAADR
jgi:integrase